MIFMLQKHVCIYSIILKKAFENSEALTVFT